MPVAIGGDNLSSAVGIGLTDLSNIGGGGATGPPGPQVPASLVKRIKFSYLCPLAIYFLYYYLKLLLHFSFLARTYIACPQKGKILSR